MVNVRSVRMGVNHCFMNVFMAVPAGYRWNMRMAVMLVIMQMCVVVRQHFVTMSVNMAFVKRQPHPDSHQRGGNHKM